MTRLGLGLGRQRVRGSRGTVWRRSHRSSVRRGGCPAAAALCRRVELTNVSERAHGEFWNCGTTTSFRTWCSSVAGCVPRLGGSRWADRMGGSDRRTCRARVGRTRAHRRRRFIASQACICWGLCHGSRRRHRTPLTSSSSSSSTSSTVGLDHCLHGLPPKRLRKL